MVFQKVSISEEPFSSGPGGGNCIGIAGWESLGGDLNTNYNLEARPLCSSRVVGAGGVIAAGTTGQGDDPQGDEAHGGQSFEVFHGSPGKGWREVSLNDPLIQERHLRQNLCFLGVKQKSQPAPRPRLQAEA